MTTFGRNQENLNDLGGMASFFAGLGQMAFQASDQSSPNTNGSDATSNANPSSLVQTLGGLGQLIGQGIGGGLSEAMAQNSTHREDASANGSAGNLGQAFGGLGQMLGHRFGQSVVDSGFEQDFSNLINPLIEELRTAPPEAPPAASSTAIDRLPKIKVSAYDLEVNNSSSCPVCLDDFVIGEEATRIPCSHLFHEGCIKKWLELNHQCPVCRYQLPTDNTFFEHGRQTSMHERRLRLRVKDLSVKSIRELRYLAEHLSVDIEGCLEKSEILDRILSSQLVEVVDEEQHREPDSNAQNSALPLEQLRAMNVLQLKAEMHRQGVDAQGCIEKNDMIDRLVLSHKSKV